MNTAQGDKTLANLYTYKTLSRRGIESPFVHYASAAELEAKDCFIHPNAMASEGPSLACTAFLQWQSRMYQKTLRNAAIAATMAPNASLQNANTDPPADTDADADDEDAGGDGEKSIPDEGGDD